MRKDERKCCSGTATGTDLRARIFEKLPWFCWRAHILGQMEVAFASNVYLQMDAGVDQLNREPPVFCCLDRRRGVNSFNSKEPFANAKHSYATLTTGPEVVQECLRRHTPMVEQGDAGWQRKPMYSLYFLTNSDHLVKLLK